MEKKDSIGVVGYLPEVVKESPLTGEPVSGCNSKG